jgi:hypothetical protein
MKNKFILLILFFLLTLISKAQFNIGVRMVSGNISSAIQNNSATNNNPKSFVYKSTDTRENYGVGIELGYGKIKVQNQIFIYGLGFTYNLSLINNKRYDTTAFTETKSSGNTYSYFIFGEKSFFIPISPKYGFMYNLNTNLRYSHTSNDDSYYSRMFSNDSANIRNLGHSNSSVQAKIQGNVGAYYMLNKHLLLFTQFNLLGLNLTFSNSNTNNLNSSSESNNVSFDMSGILTPTYKLGDINIGIKYLIPSQ